uniref:Uncharacterized protein n=1 Tax=Picea sitchensis TaxID=3332 RepID=B8LRM8_PICSI|nr:unknown [Picea sitchensis]
MKSESFRNLHKLNALMDNLGVEVEKERLKDIHTLVGKMEVFSCKESHIIGLLNIDTRCQGERSFWNEDFLQASFGLIWMIYMAL